MTSEDFLLQEWQTGDERDILSLQNQIFAQGRALEHWQWKHQSNPYPGYVIVARDKQTNELIASYGLIGFPLNFAGAKISAGQPTDTAVKEEFRKRGLLKRLAEKSIEISEETDIRLHFGFPNELALGSNLRLIFAIPTGYTECYFQTLSMSPFLNRFLPNGIATFIDAIRLWLSQLACMVKYWALKLLALRRLSYTEQPTLPDDFDDLWQRYSRTCIISTWKDSTYLNWRYCQNPSSDHSFLFARRDGKLVGFATLLVKKDVALIAELMVDDPKSIELGRSLVLLMLIKALQRKCLWIEFNGRDHGYFSQICESLKRNPQRDSVMVFKTMGDNAHLEKCATQISNWCLTAGDLDWHF